VKITEKDVLYVAALANLELSRKRPLILRLTWIPFSLRGENESTGHLQCRADGAVCMNPRMAARIRSRCVPSGPAWLASRVVAG